MRLHKRTEGGYEVEIEGEMIGTVATSRNPFHADFCYLSFDFDSYPMSTARELFERIAVYEKAPLQAMIYSYEREKAEFLRRGGFALKRRCYEVTLAQGELSGGGLSGEALPVVHRGEPEYDLCCERVYNHYKATHRAINRLTASREDFCAELPESVLCERQGGAIVHLAFVERRGAESEIAYLHSTDIDSFDTFGIRLLTELLGETAVFFEADDCDKIAMRLRILKQNPDETSFDTYTLHTTCISRENTL